MRNPSTSEEPAEAVPSIEEKVEELFAPGGVRLVVRRRCTVCQGRSEVRSEAWGDYEAYADEGQTPEDYFLNTCGENSVPPQNRTCGNCEDGWTADEIAVEDLIAAVLEQVPASVLPREDLDRTVAELKEQITAALRSSHHPADADTAAAWLRVVQEGAEALRAVSELLIDRSRR